MAVSEKTKVKRHRLAKAMIAEGHPDFNKLQKGHADYQSELIKALNYASGTFEPETAKTFVKDYAKEKLNVNVSPIPAWELINIGNICWLALNDAYIRNMEEYHDRIKNLIEKYTISGSAKIVDIGTVKTGQIIAELEGLLDDIYLRKENLMQPLKLIQSVEGRGINYKQIETHFKTQLDQINDPEYSEGYENISSDNKKRMIAGLTIILKDLEKFVGTKKTSASGRKPRTMKPRKIVPSKMVRKLNYLKEFPELSLKSIQPEKIVGADVVWVYNTKTRKLGKYVANDGTGIMVKGSTLLNYNTEQSISKKLRKPKEILDKLNSFGKVEQRKLMDDIRAVGSTLNGRINKDTILVKVY